MKVYIVNRKDQGDWDETISAVVVANDELQAVSVAFWNCYKFSTIDNLYAEEVDLNSKPRVLLSQQ